MNQVEKEKILYWRGEGLGYKAIAAKTGLSEASVKGFCQRNGLGGEATMNIRNTCRQCKKPLERKPRGGEKKFCSDGCRSIWWNNHPYLREARESNRRNCIHCGDVFFCEPSATRKYCGRPCYIAARFGKDVRRYDK